MIRKHCAISPEGEKLLKTPSLGSAFRAGA